MPLNNTPPQPQPVYRILAINPGSTSTKVAVYENDTLLFHTVARHNKAEFADFDDILQQQQLRMDVVCKLLAQNGIELTSLHAIAGRGGLVEPIESGTYRVNDRMLRDLVAGSKAMHASVLGAIMAEELARRVGIPAYVVDPIVVDEMDQYARLTGLPGIERKSAFHALNQKAVARRCARDMAMPYENARFVVAHMGGGITVGAHRYGRVIDVNDAMAGEGPFSPERTGGLPVLEVIRLCFSGAYTQRELEARITQKGGMMAYLGTNDLTRCERLIKQGDEYAALVLESMAYQISKEIGSMIAVLEGRVDAIILTGGLAFSNRFTGSIKQRLSLMAPIRVYPGEDELWALAQGVLRVLRGEEPELEY